MDEDATSDPIGNDESAAGSAEREPVEEWSNWSGNLTFEPESIARPETEREVQELVRDCAEAGRTVRVVGSGHSWTPVVETDDQLVSLERMSGVVSHDSDEREATILGGTTLQELGPELQERHLAFPNLGDVSLQTIAGAFGTGTHGTGAEFENLSARLAGGRLVTADGEIRTFSAESDPEFLRAAQVSLGTLGIFTELRLDPVPTYRIERREYCTTFENAREHVPRLVKENRNFDFYWYPRSDEESTLGPIGKTCWAIPGGHVPAESTGPEPEMVSRDELCVLNAGEKAATLEITLRYAGGCEAGPYPLSVAPRRVRHVRVNDLIDPYAPPLGEAYGIVVESSVPVVVQFTRTDTRQAENATLSTVAYGEGEIEHQ